MASESADPPGPQTVIETKGGTPQTAFTNAYVDRGITKRNSVETAAAVVPERSGSTTLGEIVVYDVPGVDHAPGDQGAVKPPHSPNSWRMGRDPYAVGGMTSTQPFFDKA